MQDAAAAEVRRRAARSDPRISPVRWSTRIRWVQLPSAGIEAFAESMRLARIWTSAKGAYALPVGEHALALTLAPAGPARRAVARTWEPQSGRSLHGMRAVVVGAGGIGRRIMDLLHVFDVEGPRPCAAARAGRGGRSHDPAPTICRTCCPSRTS